MSALKQYIELFRNHSDLVCKPCPEVMNKPREKALHNLENCFLPKVGSENYEKTDLEALLSTDYGLNIARVPLDVNPSESFHCDVPNLTPNLFLLLNDSFSVTQRSFANLPEGVTVGSLAEMARKKPELIEKYYNRIADKSNPLVNLNTLLAQDGFFLHVAKGTKVERPIQLVDILQYASPLMSVRRLLIVIEDEAQAKLLLCDHTQNNEVNFLNLQTIEIYVGRNAEFDFYDLEESTQKTTRLSSLYLSQQACSNVMISALTLFNGTTRNEFFCRYSGENSKLHLCGFGIEDQRRKLDNYSRIEHLYPNCHSEELFKYVIDDNATGAFSGLIYVGENAEKTVAYQGNRNIVGSDSATMFSKPQLEIYNDDVKCSHGSATGQLDAMQLFYMRTRGISEKVAKLLLKQAFMSDVVETVRIPVLRDRIKLLIERRFAGEQYSCSSCHSDCLIPNEIKDV